MGSWKVATSALLTDTDPASIRRGTRFAVHRLRVHRLELSPYRESFASVTASSSSATRMMASVGPNVSSRMHFMEWSTSTGTVGSKKLPCAPRFAADQNTCALGHRVVHVVLHDIDLTLCHHRADIAGKAARLVHSLPQRLGLLSGVALNDESAALCGAYGCAVSDRALCGAVRE
jgi:hypothetical protein